EGLGPEVRPATVEVALGHESFEPLESLRGSRLRAIGLILQNHPAKKSRGPRFQRGSWAGCIAQAHHRASQTTVTAMFPTIVRHHRCEGPLNQGNPPC